MKQIYMFRIVFQTLKVLFTKCKMQLPVPLYVAVLHELLHQHIYIYTYIYIYIYIYIYLYKFTKRDKGLIWKIRAAPILVKKGIFFFEKKRKQISPPPLQCQSLFCMICLKIKLFAIATNSGSVCWMRKSLDVGLVTKSFCRYLLWFLVLPYGKRKHHLTCFKH